MNITDAKVEKFQGDMLKVIFDRQRELMDKYHYIEVNSGLCQTEDVPVMIDDRRGQARIKDFSWRVMEEVGEALDALSSRDYPHYMEELVDGLHFLTELTILSGMEKMLFSEGDVDSLSALWGLALKENGEFTVKELVANLVKDLGMTCNCLKNKPWKQSMMLTDINNFQSQLYKVWVDYMAILASAFAYPREVVEVYLKKSQVNKFRQRSNY